MGVPVVVPEPSCLSSFRDELPNLLADDPRAHRLAGLARSLSEHLLATGAVAPRGSKQAAAQPDRDTVIVHPHCQGRATTGTASDELVLKRLGYRPTTLDAGCCGLAGSFSFSAKTAEVGEQIARDYWLPKLHVALDSAAAANGGAPVTVAMDGFSCVTQLKQLDGMPQRTIPSLIAEAMRGAAG